MPTSAITGEGICDLLWLFVRLTQSMMMDRLMFVEELQCTVLEVKVVEGYGHTIDAVLINGRMREGDKVCLKFDILIALRYKLVAVWLFRDTHRPWEAGSHRFSHSLSAGLCTSRVHAFGLVLAYHACHGVHWLFDFARISRALQMVICGLQGPIVTNVRSILTPHPLKELRVKNTYITHKEIKAAQVRSRSFATRFLTTNYRARIPPILRQLVTSRLRSNHK